MDPFYQLVMKLFIILWANALKVTAMVYGGRFGDEVQKFTVLCPDDDAKPALMSFSGGPCYPVSFEHENFQNNVYFYFNWEDYEEVQDHIIELLNTRSIIPDGVGSDGLTYVRFPLASGSDAMLDIGHNTEHSEEPAEYAGEVLNHEVAARMYDAMSCES